MYSQRFSDKVLEQRQCVSLATGLEYLEFSFSSIMYQYSRMFNKPNEYKIQRKNTQRYKEKLSNDKSTFNHDIVLDENEDHKGSIKPVNR